MVKQIFSKKWKASKQPRKQRKYSYNSPEHVLGKNLSTTLTKDLRKKYGTRNVEIRKGDEVEIMRGKFKKKNGKIVEVNRSKQKIVVENIQRTKKDGTKVNVYFHPSALRIKSLTEDKKRFKRQKINKTEEKNAQEKK